MRLLKTNRTPLDPWFGSIQKQPKFVSEGKYFLVVTWTQKLTSTALNAIWDKEPAITCCLVVEIFVSHLERDVSQTNQGKFVVAL